MFFLFFSYYEQSHLFQPLFSVWQILSLQHPFNFSPVWSLNFTLVKPDYIRRLFRRRTKSARHAYRHALRTHTRIFPAGLFWRNSHREKRCCASFSYDDYACVWYSRDALWPVRAFHTSRRNKIRYFHEIRSREYYCVTYFHKTISDDFLLEKLYLCTFFSSN